MNFKELVAETVLEAGLSATAPASVEGQAGDTASLIRKVARAWEDIQVMRPNWKWMWRTFEFALKAASGTTLYPDYDASNLPIAHFASDQFRLRLTATDDAPLPYLDHATFTVAYPVATTTADRPRVITQLPSGILRVEPAPDQAYTLRGMYYATPSTLAHDTDTPECPAHHHRAIVLRALRLYAASEEAFEWTRDMKEQWASAWAALLADQLPPITIAAAPLA